MFRGLEGLSFCSFSGDSPPPPGAGFSPARHFRGDTCQKWFVLPDPLGRQGPPFLVSEGLSPTESFFRGLLPQRPSNWFCSLGTEHFFPPPRISPPVSAYWPFFRLFLPTEYLFFRNPRTGTLECILSSSSNAPLSLLSPMCSHVR